jgi:hypothetical protein
MSDGENEESQQESVRSSNRSYKFMAGKMLLVNLKDYNNSRKAMLPKFDVTRDDIDDEETFNEANEVEKANTLKQDRCTGNLEVSLFWEEKIAIVIRTLQLYSIMFMFYFEEWPSLTRQHLTPMFASWLLSFHLRSQEQYYIFIKDFNEIWVVTCIYLGALLVLIAILSYMNCKRRLKYRLEFTYSKSINWFRWVFWLVEALYLPVLANAAWAGNCSFFSKRAAVFTSKCYSNKTDPDDYESIDVLYHWLLKAAAYYAILMAVVYNLILLYIIQTQKISTQFHERAV